MNMMRTRRHIANVKAKHIAVHCSKMMQQIYYHYIDERERERLEDEKNGHGETASRVGTIQSGSVDLCFLAQ